MLSLYEILKASKTGIAPDMWTALAGANFGGAGSGAETKELTGIPPLSIRSNGTPLLDYIISGNTVQNGTPTPSNPVDVNGVGVRTENLWGETSTTDQYISNQGNTGTNPNGDVYSLKTFTVSPSTTYTFSWSGFTVGNDNNLPYIRICFYTSNGGTFISRTLVNPNDYLDKYVSFTIPNNCTYIDIRIDSEASTRGQHFDNIMFNTGSTAKPYEPYGYKIPISNGQQTTNIYLGSTQTVRQIKKLVLTGNENIFVYSGLGYIRLSDGLGVRIAPYSDKLLGIDVASASMPAFSITQRPSDITPAILAIKADSNFPNVNAFKTWLAENQITVWYVLATPETGIVNEPLMKIGDYADTLSMEQAGVQIPTLHGNTVIDVETALKPSEMYIKYQE